MLTPKEIYNEKQGTALVKKLQSRHFEAYYCANKELALSKALELIPAGSSVGWGGTATAAQIGLQDALRNGDYRVIDREHAPAEDKEALEYECLRADFFLTSANALSMNGEMVNIDGHGNRVAAIIFGPKKVLVLVGMNKVVPTLEDAITRARSVAAPMNKLRLGPGTPCYETGKCADCKSEGCICNHIVITRHCRPANRICFLLIGEELGF